MQYCRAASGGGEGYPPTLRLAFESPAGRGGGGTDIDPPREERTWAGMSERPHAGGGGGGMKYRERAVLLSGD